MKGILLDLDGVFYEGERPIPGGNDVLDWLQQREIPYRFVTNTTSRPRADLVEKLEAMGILTDRKHIFTPPVAARQWLQDHCADPVALFVPAATRSEFSTLPQLDSAAETGAAAVVLGDLGEAWDFATLNRAFRLLMDTPAPRLVALGMTRYWRAPDGLRLDTAPFVIALQHATGVEPVVLGKPATSFFEAAVAAVGVDRAECVMVGDDIRGDIGGAQAAGLQGVLVRTGKFRTGDLGGEIRPDAVLDSIADLPRWWDEHSSGHTE